VDICSVCDGDNGSPTHGDSAPPPAHTRSNPVVGHLRSISKSDRALSRLAICMAVGCILCQGGQEKCHPREGCPFGCRQCPRTSHSSTGERCQTCKDGKQPVADQKSCTQCPDGRAGLLGECHLCGLAMEPNIDRSACVVCEEGKFKHHGMLFCEFCELGNAPTTMQTECTECAPGLRSSPDETNGVCQPCGAGAQATNAGAIYVRVVVFAAQSGTARC
jgi:hypothetical protein